MGKRIKDFRVTKEWLKDRGACGTAVKKFVKMKYRRVKPSILLTALLKLKTSPYYDWADWLFDELYCADVFIESEWNEGANLFLAILNIRKSVGAECREGIKILKKKGL